ncbi:MULTISPECIES: hypothetical protein [unclassified Pseudomonas]|uniref:hypothetical protein n=1 Tax=unclassified Pseudomonas TaxID=196821 RepID=UPI000F06D727|nr:MULTISPECIES: hypothetical protein [unclassified Pseudomonas]MBD8595871.1 hypothetical protein [Pseudomonas sp. CFBP 8758]MBD8603013.1 hypothetical protein [Pseudomonas sp. CFBP 8771]MBD8731753.1 hypothetical protein [Pseudomonas sp. CFBP 13710]MBD8826687.1 hypothetical protein [Pseudomonas sp. CFBP 13602]
MTRITFLLLAALCSPSVLATTVDAYEADPLTLLDEHGKSQGRLPVKDAPKPPLQVLATHPNLDQVQVELGGRKVWLDTMDLRLSEGKIVTTPCESLPISQKADTRNASTIGFGSGCSKP